MPKKQVAVSLRKPPPVDTDAFVSAENSDRREAPTTAKISSPDPIVRHGSREFREMTLYLPTDVARELSFHCMDINRDVNGVVSEAVSRYLSPVEINEVASATAADSVRVSFTELSRQSLRTLWALRPWA